MCILIVSANAHPRYPFILLSNRDEYLDRETKLASFWEPDHPQVLAPADISLGHRGTWLGVTKQGKIVALLNYMEEGIHQSHSPDNDNNKNEHVSHANGNGICQSPVTTSFPKFSLSRGSITRRFLLDNQWSDPVEFGKHLKDDPPYQAVCGFTMFCGSLKQDIHDATKIDLSPFAVISNRPGPPLGDLVDVHNPFVGSANIIGISNSLYTDPWPKVKSGRKLLQQLVDRSSKTPNETQDQFVEECLALLSTSSFDTNAVKENDIAKIFQSKEDSIFIPSFIAPASIPNDPTAGHRYGTRTQTVILLDTCGNLSYYEHTIGDPCIDRKYSFKLDSWK